MKLEKRKAYQQESERETERGQLDQEAHEHLTQPLGWMSVVRIGSAGV